MEETTTKTHQIPSCMEDLTLEQFIDYIELSQSKEEINPIRKSIKLTSIMSGIPEDDVANMDQNDFGRLINELKWIKDIKMRTPEKIKGDVYFEIDGEKYYFTPDYYWSKIGDIATIEELLEGRNFYTAFHHILAIACRKEGEKLDREIIIERGQMFLKKLKMKDVYDAMFFFAQEEATSSLFTHVCSKDKATQQKLMTLTLLTLANNKSLLGKNGTGTQS